MAGKNTNKSSGKAIKPIVIKRPGALTAKAKAAGEGVQQFAKEHKNDGGLTGKQANFAVNAAKWKK
jgi:hypothetical protein